MKDIAIQLENRPGALAEMGEALLGGFDDFIADVIFAHILSFPPLELLFLCASM